MKRGGGLHKGRKEEETKMRVLFCILGWEVNLFDEYGIVRIHGLAIRSTGMGLLLVVNSTLAAEKKPNILFLLADDQRADTIRSLAGNDRIHTPNLDALAARGMSFSRATCSYSICWMSRSEIMSGMHGWEH